MFPMLVTSRTLSLAATLGPFGPTILLNTAITTMKIRKIITKAAILFFGNLDLIEKPYLKKHINILRLKPRQNSRFRIILQQFLNQPSP
jgi:hypothetical protein